MFVAAANIAIGLLHNLRSMKIHTPRHRQASIIVVYNYLIKYSIVHSGDAVERGGSRAHREAEALKREALKREH